MEVIDIGRLIESIQERTFLWDEKNNHYRDRKARDMAWMEIGDEVSDDWAQLSRTEKAERAKLLKGKWRHLKDSFLRSVRLGHDSIYADSLYFLRDNFLQRSSSLKQNKKVSVKNKVQKNSHEANENSSSNAFQNSNGLSSAQPSLSQEISDCSSSDSIQNTNGLKNVQPSLSQGTSNSSSFDSIQNTNRQKNVQPSLSQGTSNNSSPASIHNTNRRKKVQPSISKEMNKNAEDIPTNRRKRVQPTISQEMNKNVEDIPTNSQKKVQPIISQEMNKNAEDSPKQDKSDEKLFLDSLLRDYRELDEDDKLDFRIMCLQLIRKARKKRNSQNHTSPVISSQ